MNGNSPISRVKRFKSRENKTLQFHMNVNNTCISVLRIKNRMTLTKHWPCVLNTNIYLHKHITHTKEAQAWHIYIVAHTMCGNLDAYTCFVQCTRENRCTAEENAKGRFEP